MIPRPAHGGHHDDGRRPPWGRPRAVLPRALAVLGGVAAAALAAAPPAPAQSTPFNASTLAGTALSRPTSLQFGPDRRLYVAQQNGIVKAHTVVRAAGPDGRGAYRVTGTETITLVTAIPNHTDRGAPAPGVRNRHVTGLHVAGTPEAPVVYVVSSDPQVSAGAGGLTLDVDTNSGVLSKLTRGPQGWTKTDLVRGLPRSVEQHSANGITRRGGTLFIAVGGNTNNGAPSQNFGGVPEYALSAAILRVDLAAVEARAPYDLPTLDDPTRPGVQDPGDPFGGNAGANQAVLVPGGPVQIHASGTRNPYDVVLTQAGRLFTIDNGGNGGWGGLPVGEGTPGCVNREVDRGTTNPDELYDVTAPGTYAGHPNPTRGNPGGNLFGGQAAVPAPDPVQCDHRVGDGALASFRQSTNGLTEYTARRPFAGALAGNLLAADFRGQLWRIQLTGGRAVVTSLVEKAGVATLDITAQGDAPAPFPGTVWFTEIGSGRIGVLEPSTRTCDLRVADADGDGYLNGDEDAAGTDPCSPADRPDDVDGDRVSDVSDDDDDGDGLRDVVDPFARDAANGLDRPAPFTFDWENDESAAGGSIWNLGFRGLMTNGSDDYLRQFDPAGLTVGGAAGVLTVDQADDGDATGPANSQRNAFQFGIAARPAGGSVTVRTRIVAPFADAPPQEGQSFGAYVGTGGQDDYVKLVVGGDGGPSATLVREVGGAVTRTKVPLALPTSSDVDLLLTADPRSALVQAAVASPAGGAPTPVGAPVAVPAAWFTNPSTGLAVGIISSSPGAASPFDASWDEIAITPGPALTGAGGPGAAPGAPGGTSSRVDRKRPTLRNVRLSRTRVRTAGRRSRRGTTVRFHLSEAATVQLTVARRTTGRRVRGSCRRTTRANRRARTCVRYAAVRGRIAKPLRAGRTRAIRFDGRMAGRRLKRGRHRMTLVAIDRAGNRSRPVRVAFRVVR